VVEEDEEQKDVARVGVWVEVRPRADRLHGG
jgi:hypothetical protein